MLHTAEKISWDELLDEYFFSRMPLPSTECSYRRMTQVFIRFIGEMVLPENVTHRDVLRWRRHLLREKKQSSHTWNNKVTCLRAIFNFGMKRKLLPYTQNPFDNTVVKDGLVKKEQKTGMCKNQPLHLPGTNLNSSYIELRVEGSQNCTISSSGTFTLIDIRIND
ncbi:recombinase XerD [Xenorhabdus beddingii]|uniref:Recombinase XerD n=1 Tax=Xenorhabdus beddingii TaxID=40578 RepID=A0A1Y2SIR0_9GAMM|nr:site-specific integrase [Xenorhabdus beddingii]OTA18579.1 recombinase XerD [Xenorhabdus beddingii]